MVDMAKLREAESVLSHVILSRGDQLTSQDITAIVDQYRPVFFDGYYQFQPEDIDYLIRSLEAQYITTMGAGVSLIDHDIPHDEEWYLKREINWNYWQDYQTYLIRQMWPTRVVNSMDLVTNKILGLLQDPQDVGDWERRGLVIGHVQSGKTANYIGLISKAADAGYKFIIVIAGIHNNLRRQTQERIDWGFIGRDSVTKEYIGVGEISPKRAMPLTVTTLESDFNKSLARRFDMELKSLNNTFILVIKKNVNTLSSLYTWLKQLNTRKELEKISDIPMLLIDDEADNASINTNKPQLDPTRTNKEIRGILNLFRKRCYVGYTATPFANIFIDPDDEHEMLGQNLFPEHFIYCLDSPSNYFGSEKIFLDDDLSSTYIREIDDAEDYIPLKHKKDDPIPALPPSLKAAIRTFILTRAIRNARGQDAMHCSMMINVSRFINVQREIRLLTEVYLNKLKQSVRFNYRLSFERAGRDEHMAKLYESFRAEFARTGVKWTDILDELNNAVDDARVFLVNSKSDEALDYSTYTKEGNSLTAIAIGGLSLSRGLTLEGLTVSYIYRNTKMYDTLLQMGRWFGYRDGYEDLCRVYMSDASRGWYSHISEAAEELRLQIKRMRRERKKPSDFGLYVRAHPDSLIVTAMNKMRYTQQMALRVSYDGKLLETHIIPGSSQKNDYNRTQLTTFFEELRSDRQPHVENNSFLFTDVNWKRIQDCILRFNFHVEMFDLEENIPRFIKEVADIYPEWDVAFRSLKNKPPEEGYMITAQERNIGHEPSGQPRRPASESGWHTGNKNRFSGNSMFSIGLDREQLNEAQSLANVAGRKNPIFSDYTNARGKPILMLHLLNLVDKKNNDRKVLALAPALSVSFPNSTEFRTVEYVVGPVWLKQFEESMYDLPDEEDDYDFE